MKRRAFLKEYSLRIAMTVLLFCILVYTVYHAAGSTAGSLQTTPARQINDRRLIGAQVYLFRDENLLTVPQKGLVNTLVKSGSKVGKNTVLAEVWSGDGETTDEMQQTLDLLNRSIRILEESIPGETVSLSQAEPSRSAAASDLLAVRRAIRNGSWSRIPKLSDEILLLLNRFRALTGNREEIQSTLDQLKAVRDRVLTGTKTAVANGQSSGYYFDRSTVDGYETIFTAYELENLTAARLRELAAMKPARDADGFAVGKISYTFRWYLAAELSPGDAAFFTEGGLYPFAFPENSGVTLELTCTAVRESESGTVAVFASDTSPEDFVWLRTQNAEITVGSVAGYYVPDRAVVTQGDLTGVYVFENNTVLFRRVAVLYEGDGYLIAAREDNDPESEFAYLSVNDLMITSGKNLYHGKVYR